MQMKIKIKMLEMVWPVLNIQSTFHDCEYNNALMDTSNKMSTKPGRYC